MFTFVNALIVIAAVFIGLIVLCFIYEPGRKRRVLATLRNHRTWMFGRDLSNRAKVRFVYVTLAGLEDQGLVERLLEEKPADADEDFRPRPRYRLTGKGRRVTPEQARS